MLYVVIKVLPLLIVFKVISNQITISRNKKVVYFWIS